MKTSQRHQERIAREDGCRIARRAVEEQRRRIGPADPALRRLHPLG
jgi:hypothetical protein